MSSLFNLASATVGGGHQARNGGYRMQRSVRLRSSASAYFNRTFTSVGTRTKFTYSAWLKRGTLGSFSRFLSDSTNNSYLRFNTSNALDWNFHNGTSSFTIVTSQVFRDPSAWYHVIVAVDTTQATNTNRVKIYINGSQVTAFSSSAYPNQNDVSGFNNNTAHYISGYSGTAEFLDGYLTEVNFIDGQALDSSSFGETNPYTGVWQAKRYTGTYGTNGFYLNFSDNSAATAAAIGKDYSGLGNNWTPNNISVTAGATYDSMLDVPTQWADGDNGRGNYCTWSPIDRPDPSPNSYTLTLSNGNLNTATGGAEGFVNNTTLATFQVPTTGKWYWEILVTNVATAASTRSAIGIMNQAAKFADGSDFTYATVAGVYGYSANGQKATSPNLTLANYGNSYTNNDVIGVAVDSDAGKIWFAKNGTWQNSGSPTGGTNEAFSGLVMTQGFQPAIGYWLGCTANFGQRPFAYTPPSGFKALNTLNLPTPTILKGNQYFDATIWTGDGTGNRAITNSGSMQPDLVWLKIRNQAFFHRLTDSVRGATKELYSNATDAEFTQSQGLLSFDANGFTVGTSTSYNGSGNTYVGWQWKKGATQGFDIVTYTGTGVAQNISHSLGVEPKMIIVKNRNTASYGWFVWHTAFGAAGNTDYINLNLTDAKGSGGAVSMWNTTMPTSSVFSIGTYAGVNGNTNTYVAYLFSEVAGFSKFGSYTGNGSSDGVFVHLGFRARYLLIKETGNANSWEVYDTARNSANVQTQRLFPNDSLAEATTDPSLDILSNGFKCRAGNTGINRSGGTYIFAAFAENPFKNALAR